MCFYMANSLRAGLEPAFAPYNRAFLSIRRPRVPEVNYSPAWMLSADSINHIETHCLLFLADYFYLKQPGARLPGSMCFYMVDALRIELR